MEKDVEMRKELEEFNENSADSKKEKKAGKKVECLL